MPNTLRCPSCEGEELSPPATYQSGDTLARFEGKGGTNFLGAEKDLCIWEKTVRVCLDCGYFMTYASRGDLETLRKSLE